MCHCSDLDSFWEKPPGYLDSFLLPIDYYIGVEDEIGSDYYTVLFCTADNYKRDDSGYTYIVPFFDPEMFEMIIRRILDYCESFPDPYKELCKYMHWEYANWEGWDDGEGNTIHPPKEWYSLPELPSKKLKKKKKR